MFHESTPYRQLLLMLSEGEVSRLTLKEKLQEALQPQHLLKPEDKFVFEDLARKSLRLALAPGEQEQLLDFCRQYQTQVRRVSRALDAFLNEMIEERVRDLLSNRESLRSTPAFNEALSLHIGDHLAGFHQG